MEERHKLLLIKQNPQWVEAKIEVPEFKRDLFPIVEKYLNYKQIIAIVGMRRVGKTILIKQLINQIKASHKNVCYISFDDRDFQKYELAEEIINYFLKNSDEKNKRFLLLDEIQKVSNWQDLLKTFYDTETNLKIVISGSSSLELEKYKENLAGRILTFHMPIFSFREYVRYKNLPWQIKFDNLVKEYDAKFLPQKNLYHDLFERYILKGAFPELIEIDDEEYIKKYVSDVIEKIISDISKYVEAGKETEINELIALFCKSTAQIFEVNNISNLLKLNRNTISRYLSLLEKTFLIRTSYNFTRSVAKKIRLSKKGYIAHSCIPIAVLNYPFEILRIEGTDLGHLVETGIVSNLSETCFWRFVNYEVDVVLKDKTPVEIKYQNQISKSDLTSLLNFLDKFKLKKGILVTKNTMELRKENGKEIFLIPAWMFLLTTD